MHSIRLFSLNTVLLLVVVVVLLLYSRVSSALWNLASESWLAVSQRKDLWKQRSKWKRLKNNRGKEPCHFVFLTLLNDTPRVVVESLLSSCWLFTTKLRPNSMSAARCSTTPHCRWLSRWKQWAVSWKMSGAKQVSVSNTTYSNAMMWIDT